MEGMAAEIEQSVDLGVCRDVVGTQFALILGLLISRLAPIGKPLYMTNACMSTWKFVNVGHRG